MAKKIVVIDDEPSVCDLLKKLFKREGYDVKTEVDAVKAIEVVAKENPDCVLLDIKMPKMGGIEVLCKIRKFNKHIGIIMITGYGNLETAMESMKMGAFDYITKPFDLHFIKNLVERCLEKEAV